MRSQHDVFLEGDGPSTTRRVVERARGGDRHRRREDITKARVWPARPACSGERRTLAGGRLMAAAWRTSGRRSCTGPTRVGSEPGETGVRRHAPRDRRPVCGRDRALAGVAPRAGTSRSNGPPRSNGGLRHGLVDVLAGRGARRRAAGNPRRPLHV